MSAITIDARVEAYEEIRTQAGRFAAFRVARDGGAERVLLWWSPDVQHGARSRSVGSV